MSYFTKAGSYLPLLSLNHMVEYVSGAKSSVYLGNQPSNLEVEISKSAANFSNHSASRRPSVSWASNGYEYISIRKALPINLSEMTCMIEEYSYEYLQGSKAWGGI